MFHKNRINMKNNNLILTILCVSGLTIGCQPTENQAEKNNEQSTGEKAFEKNSATVLAYIEDWQNESINYERDFSKDFEAWGTAFGDTDTTNYEQMIEMDQKFLEMYDFKIVGGPLNLLPGVNVETKEIDGSVRFYTEWAITLTATDSTESKTGNIRMYHAYVFNEEGKITLALAYGDFGGLMSYLHSSD
jgi:hypothetical protein